MYGVVWCGVGHSELNLYTACMVWCGVGHSELMHMEVLGIIKNYAIVSFY